MQGSNERIRKTAAEELHNENKTEEKEDWEERLTQASHTAASVTPLTVGSP